MDFSNAIQPYERTSKFQQALDIIFSGYKWQTCLVYLDDVINFWYSYEDHLPHPEKILSTLSRAVVTISYASVSFHEKDEITWAHNPSWND